MTVLIVNAPTISWTNPMLPHIYAAWFQRWACICAPPRNAELVDLGRGETQ